MDEKALYGAGWGGRMVVMGKGAKGRARRGGQDKTQN